MSATSHWEGYKKIDYCYNCKGYTQRDYITPNRVDEITHEYFIVAKCHTCGKLFLYIYKEDLPEGVKFPMSRVSGIEKVTLVSVYPLIQKDLHESTPSEIKKSYLEGITSFNAGCPNAAVAMYRKSLQKICIQQGSDKNKELWEQINQVIKEDLRDEALEIRKWGNLGVHPDEIIKDVSVDNAKQIEEFVGKVCFQIYEYPSRLKYSKETREQGKNT